jgi:disulfide bond formation protein DsbB
MIEATNQAFGILGLLGQIAAAILVVLIATAIISPRARARLVTSWSALQVQALVAAWVVAAIATGGSLYFSEIAGYIPCQLCWFQRICMYPLTITLAVGAVVRGRAAALYSLVFPLVGIAVAARHLYIEANPDAESASCRVGAPCSTKWIDELGYITIPALAMTAFVLIGLLTAIAVVAGMKAAKSPTA